MPGIVVEDRVAAAAVLEPEMAPKAAPVIAVAWASPPGTRPIQVRAIVNISSLTPLTTMKFAIRMNIGMMTNS